MASASLRAEQSDLRDRMRERGMSHREIAAEFARRYKFRPRAAYRHAFGWTLTQAAARINAYAAENGLDDAGRAPMSGSRLCELENFPTSTRSRRLTPQVLAVLAGVYDTDIHALVDLEDREFLTPADQLLLNSVRSFAPEHTTPASDAERVLPPAASTTDGGSIPLSRSETPTSLSLPGGQGPVVGRHVSVVGHPGDVDLVDIARLRQRVDDLDVQYDRMPSVSLLPEASELFALAGYLRSRASTPRLRRELLTVEAEAAILMGQLVWDASQRRDHRQARGYLERAASAGRELRNPIVEGLALLRSTIIALYGERTPQVALDLAGRCVEVTEGTSGVLSGLAMLHAAEAHAMVRRAGECEDLLGQASQLLGGVDESDEAFHLYSPGHIPRMAGSCYLSLGRPQAAEGLLEQVTSARGAAKADAIVLGNLALARIRQRKPEEAGEAFDQVLDVVSRTWGGGGITMAFAVSRELKPWRHVPAVRESSDRLLDVMASAAGSAL